MKGLGISGIRGVGDEAVRLTLYSARNLLVYLSCVRAVHVCESMHAQGLWTDER